MKQKIHNIFWLVLYKKKKKVYHGFWETKDRTGQDCMGGEVGIKKFLK